jgi:hypothetical protein
MAGLADLDELLLQMEPVLDEKEYIFASFPGARYGDLASLGPVAAVQEKEGLSLVIERSVADAAQIPAEASFKRISLNVHCSLEAVGLTVAIAGVLSEHGVSANMIAGYFHDHVFVPSGTAREALQILKDLSRVN